MKDQDLMQNVPDEMPIFVSDEVNQKYKRNMRNNSLEQQEKQYSG